MRGLVSYTRRNILRERRCTLQFSASRECIMEKERERERDREMHQKGRFFQANKSSSRGWKRLSLIRRSGTLGCMHEISLARHVQSEMRREEEKWQSTSRVDARFFLLIRMLMWCNSTGTIQSRIQENVYFEPLFARTNRFMKYV